LPGNIAESSPPIDNARFLAGSGIGTELAPSRCMDTSIYPSNLLHGDLTSIIIGAFYETFNEMGTGFNELICRRGLATVLRMRGLNAVEEDEIPVWFRGELLAKFKADIVVNDAILVEVKAVRELEDWHTAQILNYLKASTIEVGLLVNFGKRADYKRFVMMNHRKRGTPETKEPGTKLPVSIPDGANSP
jgi:GxxExxY protein